MVALCGGIVWWHRVMALCGGIVWKHCVVASPFPRHVYVPGTFQLGTHFQLNELRAIRESGSNLERYQLSLQLLSHECFKTL